MQLLLIGSDRDSNNENNDDLLSFILSVEMAEVKTLSLLLFSSRFNSKTVWKVSMDGNCYIFSLLLSFSFTHTHTFSPSLTPARILSFSLSLSRSLSHTHSFSLLHTDTFSPFMYFCVFYSPKIPQWTHIHTLSYYLCHTLSHTSTHSLSLSL